MQPTEVIQNCFGEQTLHKRWYHCYWFAGDIKTGTKIISCKMVNLYFKKLPFSVKEQLKGQAIPVQKQEHKINRMVKVRQKSDQ